MSTFYDLMDSVNADELILVEGGILQFYRKKDGDITLSLIISTLPGSGSRMLERLYEKCPGKLITLRCPLTSSANEWWQKKGFRFVRQETTRKGTVLNVYQKRSPDDNSNTH